MLALISLARSPFAAATAASFAASTAACRAAAVASAFAIAAAFAAVAASTFSASALRSCSMRSPQHSAYCCAVRRRPLAWLWLLKRVRRYNSPGGCRVEHNPNRFSLLALSFLTLLHYTFSLSHSRWSHSRSRFVAKRRRSESHLHVRRESDSARRLERMARVRVGFGDRCAGWSGWPVFGSAWRRAAPAGAAGPCCQPGDGLHRLAHRDLLRPSSRRPGPLAPQCIT